jgi:large subunit ribosomal protein L3
MSGILGRKIGMARIFNEIGDMVPVTVIEAGPCSVIQIKKKDKDGYEAVQLGYGSKKNKNVTRPMQGHLKKAGVQPPFKAKEFRIFKSMDLKVGDQIKVDVFKPGQVIKISGLSKGRGFTGVVKRHGFGGGPVTHGQSDRLRAPGSLGQSSDPSRVFKGYKMAGRMGNKKVTALNLLVVMVDVEKNLMFVKGSVPGARNSMLEIYTE